jgi:hypothetical protein
MEKFIRGFTLFCLVMLVAVIALFTWKPVHAAPEEFSGGLLIAEEYSYLGDKDVKIAKIQAPMEVYRRTQILEFTAICSKPKPKPDLKRLPVVDITMRWYPDAWLGGWSLQTTVKSYTDDDAESIREVHLYTDVTDPRTSLYVANVRPCPSE